MSNKKWDKRFLELAEHIAGWSKDPSTKVGSVLVRPDNTIASVGYNGLPKGVDDLDERIVRRELKYEMTVHSEINTLNFLKEDAKGYTLYVWPIPPCSRCAGSIINSGVSRVVSPQPNDRWKDSCSLGERMFREAGVEYVNIKEA